MGLEYKEDSEKVIKGQGFVVSEDGRENIPGKERSAWGLRPNNSVLVAYHENGHTTVVTNPTN